MSAREAQPAEDPGSESEPEQRPASPSTDVPLELGVVDHTGRLGDDTVQKLEHQIGAACVELEITSGMLDVSVVDDPRMAQLHREHLNLDSPTDVLTFDHAVAADSPMAGEIVVCLDEAARQAAGRHDVELELLLYVVHGLLHLLGYDDHDPAESRAMHEREDELLVAIGCPAVYRSGNTAEVGQ